MQSLKIPIASFSQNCDQSHFEEEVAFISTVIKILLPPSPLSVRSSFLCFFGSLQDMEYLLNLLNQLFCFKISQLSGDIKSLSM